MSYKYGYGLCRRMGKYCGHGCAPVLLTIAAVGLGFLALRGCGSTQHQIAAQPPPPEPKEKAKK